jgi:Tfp pilus assembly protein PilF
MMNIISNPRDLLAGGQILEALQAAEAALKTDCNNAELYNIAGVCAITLGDRGRAEQYWRQTIRIDPRASGACFNLGLLCARSQREEEAEQYYRATISIDPGNIGAYNNLGLLFARRKQEDKAEYWYRKAIEINSGNSESYTNLGALLAGRHKDDEAEHCHRKAAGLNPGSAEIHSNLAGLLANRYCGSSEAEDHYLQAIALSPESAFSHSNYGVFLTNQKRDGEAEDRFRKALAIDCDYQLAHLNLGFLLLSQGRFDEGWVHHESRYSPGLPDSGIPLPDLPYPKWQGEPLTGKSLLVWLEQVLGDEIQFCRFLPQLKKKWGVRHVTYVCKASLKRLMETLECVDTVIALNEIGPDLQPHDYWTLPLSFPLFWKGEIGTFPVRIPYLKALPERIANWQPRLPGDGFRVGLVWRGNAKHHNDDDRSLPGLSTLAPLWTVPGVRFVSLQMGSGADEANAPPQGQSLSHLGFDIADFADTAAIIDQLDLLICVDTAVAHLAGALGKACWVLLPAYRTDWSWLRGRSDSPWYPGIVRLFRQTTRGDWTPVIENVRKALSQAVFLKGPGMVRIPTGH